MKKFLTDLDDWIAVIFTSLIILVTVSGVFMRYFMNAPLQWLEEVTVLLFVWSIMLGAASALKHRGHISIDVFVVNFPENIQIAIKFLNHLVTLFVLTSLAVLGYQLAMKAGEKITPMLSIPYTYIDIAVPVGAAWMILHALRMFWEDVELLRQSGKAKTGKEEADV